MLVFILFAIFSFLAIRGLVMILDTKKLVRADKSTNLGTTIFFFVLAFFFLIAFLKRFFQEFVIRWEKRVEFVK